MEISQVTLHGFFHSPSSFFLAASFFSLELNCRLCTLALLFLVTKYDCYKIIVIIIVTVNIIIIIIYLSEAEHYVLRKLL